MTIAIIGGGAAGFFSAIHAKENHPDARVVLFEKSPKVLAKVKISGGGRCNVTNGCSDVSELCLAYPRGGKKLKRAFHRFNTSDTMAWFENRGVPLVTQEDNCVFPQSQDSQSIIDCLLQETKRLGIKVYTRMPVVQIIHEDDQLTLHFSNNVPKERFDKVIVATGGSPKRKGLEWLEALGHHIEDPVPSLFTFNMPQESITQLMGIVVEPALVDIPSTKLRADGPLLITHWGMSGPAILKLSAFGARYLSEQAYEFQVRVNWVHEANQEYVVDHLLQLSQDHPKKFLANIRPYYLPQRLWHFLLQRRGISAEKRWGELGKKTRNQLVSLLTNDLYQVKGKTTFKEEFVTCGGVGLTRIDLNTMQSKVCPNLYFSGEVMDIDGITGGYNFQAAWTTGFIAGQLG